MSRKSARCGTAAPLILMTVLWLMAFPTVPAAAQAVQALIIKPTQLVAGGADGAGTVTLTAKATTAVEVSLISSNPSALAVDPKVVVPIGASEARFMAHTQPTAADVAVAVTAYTTAGAVSLPVTVLKSAPATVTANLILYDKDPRQAPAPETSPSSAPTSVASPKPGLQAFSQLTAGHTVWALIRLSSPATEDYAFTVRSDRACVKVPTTPVRVAKGQKEATFPLATTQVTLDETAVISAETAGGALRAEASLTIALDITRTLGFVLVSLLVSLLLLFAVPWCFGVVFGTKLGGILYGADGLPSTSRAQSAIWTLFVVAAYISLAAARFGAGVPITLTITTNLVVAMGISIATGVAARAIAINQAERGLRPNRASAAPVMRGADDKGKSLKYLFTNDDGRPNQGKIQVMAWTVVAVSIFVADWVRQVNAADPATMDLPTIDGALMVLMALMNGGYLGDKLTAEPSDRRPRLILDSLNPGKAKPKTAIAATISGHSATPDPAAVHILVDGTNLQWPVTKCEGNKVTFTVLANATAKPCKICLAVDGIAITNELDFTVEPAPTSTTEGNGAPTMLTKKPNDTL